MRVSYVYDLLGRQTQDCITTLGTGVDSTVLRIATTYEVRGMVTGLTSYNNATVGSGTVVNDVQLQYNSFAQLIADYQSHIGSVNFVNLPGSGVRLRKRQWQHHTANDHDISQRPHSE